MPADARSDPARGVRVVVTRDEPDDGPLSAALERRGAVALHWPAVRTADPMDPAPLEGELERLKTFDWIVFTSRRAVAAVTGRGVALPRELRVAAVGEATAEAIRAAGWRVDVVPAAARASGLTDALGEAGVGPGSRVLFPASAIARDTVPAGLRALGATVVRVTAYRTVPASLDPVRVAAELDQGIDAVAFASPSAVTGLRDALGGRIFDRLMSVATVAVIGPTTRAAAVEAGAVDVIEAEETTFEGLAERISAAVGQSGP